MVFLDDDGGASAAPAPDPGADRRAAAFTPEARALAVLEFEGLCSHLVSKAIAFGQTRAGFLTSLMSMWDQRKRSFDMMVMAQAAAAAAPTPEAKGPG